MQRLAGRPGAAMAAPSSSSARSSCRCACRGVTSRLSVAAKAQRIAMLAVVRDGAPVRAAVSRRGNRLVCSAEAAAEPAGAPARAEIVLPRTGFFISKTEVPAFIPRDDMMDQMIRWALIEAEEGGQRNFGMPMKIKQLERNGMLWGFDVDIIKEGNIVASMGIGFDGEATVRSEWIGQDTSTGMPTKEGKQDDVDGKHFEIWKICDRPVDEDLRATIRAFCTGLVAALNKYYAFGSVFAEEV